MLEYDVFASYAYQDRAVVIDVVQFLETIGVTVWFDKHRIEHRPLVGQLRGSAGHASRFLLFLSRYTSRSTWVTDELHWFLKSDEATNVAKLLVIQLEENAELPHCLLGADIPCCINLSSCFLDGLAELALKFVPHPAGILKFFPRRQDVPDSIWNLLYERVGRDMRLMGHSLVKAVDGEVRKYLLSAIGERKVTSRILLLTPDVSGLQQVQEVQHGLSRNVSLPAKIKFTVEKIRELKSELGQAGGEDRLSVRSTRRIMYSSVGIFDSIALITNYSNRGDIGNTSPTFLVSKTREDDLYSNYSKEFEHYWGQAEHPEEMQRNRSVNDSARILSFARKVDQIQDWSENPQMPLPAPAEMIIHPTYRCSSTPENNDRFCPDCMYQGMQSDRDLELNLLRGIIQDAVDMGVHRFELSGGGEPLQYEEIGALFEFLREVKDRNPDIHFGLLTNGMYMTPEHAEAVATAFSYVRFSCAEGVRAHQDRQRQFVRNIQMMLERVMGNPRRPSVGLKLLVSSENAAGFVPSLLELKAQLGVHFLRLNQICVKAMRSTRQGVELNSERARTLRHQFFEQLFVDGNNWPANIHVDLDLRYVDVNRFRCRLSPLCAVVDPNAALLVCFNYRLAHKQLQIGSLHTNKLRELWGSQRHHEVLQDMNVTNVCNAHCGSPCRFVEYHDVLWSGSEPIQCVPEAIRGFE